MKKMILISIFICSYLFLYSQNFADKNEVEILALKYINSKLIQDDTTVFRIKNTNFHSYNNHKSYFIVNFHPTGYVVMSAYKYYEPVLSYSLLHNFSFDPNNFFLNSYDYIIDSMYNSKNKNIEYSLKWNFLATEKLLRKRTSDTFLLTTYWGQGSNNEGSCGNYLGSYNKFVPKRKKCGCGHCSAGCGSLAMAQLICFWEYPPYTNKRTYDYSLMPNKLFDTTDIEEIDEVAHLISDCGKFSDMIYCVPFGDCQSFTTPNEIKRAFKNQLKYSHNIEKKKRKNYNSNQEWFNMLREELDYNRPIIYIGNDIEHDITEGHTFICDGYSTTDNNIFHFNTGNKSYAWYSIPEDNYHVFQMQVLIKIYPDVMYSCNSVVDLGVWYDGNNQYNPLLDQPWAGTIYSANENYPENYRTNIQQ